MILSRSVAKAPGGTITLYLVRHAKAVSRSEWEGAGRLRPLTPGGHRQAMRLLETLADAPVGRILSSPALRCRQTVEPLAAQRGLPLETDARLAEGADLEAALDVLSSPSDVDTVVCAHGDLIPALVARLGRPRGARLSCEKGSVWVLGDGASKAPRYIPPPARSSGAAPVLDTGAGAPRVEGALAVQAEEALEDDRAKERVAVLDLGSTSFHLLVAEATALGEIQRVVRERAMLRLGSVIASDRRVPEEVCRRAVETARSLRDVAREARADRLLPVATAALREAENGPELARRIGDAVGEPVRVLSGEEEARLMFAAFRRRVPLAAGTTLGIDLGGGSLELALGDADRLDWEQTLPLGVARLHSELVRSDPMTSAEAKAVRMRVRARVATCEPRIRGRVAACVATGGTVAALARRIATRRTSWPRRSVSQLFVPVAELEEVARELVQSSHEQRLRMRGIARQRVDLLPTGALVLCSLCDALGLDGFTVSDWGLREGVILESLGLAHAGRRRSP
jgi:exopolyphosphatase/guanosine-5'-triphosphate,3'-diphosphate pyrophosphatase